MCKTRQDVGKTWNIPIELEWSREYRQYVLETIYIHGFGVIGAV